MTIEIHGRSMYAFNPVAEIYMGTDRGDDPTFRVHGVDFQQFPKNTARFTSKHENGTDIEHDAAYVFELEIGGLQFQNLMGRWVELSAVAYAVRYYPPDFKIIAGANISELGVHDDIGDVIEVCDDTEYYHKAGSGYPAGHLLMPFMPPKQKLKAGPVIIHLNMRPEVDDKR